MTDNFDKELGETLRRVREEKGISAALIAERMNVTKQAVSLWEKGERSLRAVTVRDYCVVLGVSMQYVYDRMENGK